MATIHQNVLNNADIQYLTNYPEVLAQRLLLDAKTSGSVRFSVPVTDTIRSTLQAKLGLNIAPGMLVPMRWIKGDTPPHVDVGASNFQNTYIIYLTQSQGKLIVDSVQYPIEANTGYVFNEGLSHETRATLDTPRLLLGPMNESVQPVGSPPITIEYYGSESDATAGTNKLSEGYTFIVGNGAPTTPVNYSSYSWISVPRSSGTSPPGIDYPQGTLLNADGNYYLYPGIACFLEGSEILCQINEVEQYIPIQEIRKDMLVKSSLGGFKKVRLIGKNTIHNICGESRTINNLYKLTPSNYPELNRDLYITGGHSILEHILTKKNKADIIKHYGKLFVAAGKYRLMAHLDERAELWASPGK